LPAGAATTVQAPAQQFWPLHNSLPQDLAVPVDAGRDLRVPRPYEELHLDDILTDLEAAPSRADGLRLFGKVGMLELWASPAFREVVAFTPPHRQAVCLEPYTCITDAINLQQQG